MDNQNSQRDLFFAAAGGLAGFVVVIIAGIIYFLLVLQFAGFGFGGGILSPSENLIVSVIVLPLISLGAGIPAWAIRTKWWHGLLAGTIAMFVFIAIELNIGGQEVNYGLFSQRNTFAYISIPLVSTLIATLGRKRFQSKGYLVIFVVSLVIASLILMMPKEDNFTAGMILSLLAWILFPTVFAFLMNLEQKNGNT